MKKIASILLSGLFALGAGPLLQPNTNTAEKPVGPVAAAQTLAVEDAAGFVCGITGCTKTTKHAHNACGLESCTASGTHQHNGSYYYAHSANDGHSYHKDAPDFVCGVTGCTNTGEHGHPVCPVEDCGKTEDHGHDGALYYGHHDGDGHAHGGNGACDVAGCTLTGNHAHNEGAGHDRGERGHGENHH